MAVDGSWYASQTAHGHVQQTRAEEAADGDAGLTVGFTSFATPRLNSVAVDDLSFDSFVSRRRDVRVVGPFHGRRLGALNAPIRVYDLSVGGCLIDSLRNESIGRRLKLLIDLPYEETFRLEGEILDIRPDHRCAARFVDQSDEAKSRLKSVIRQLIGAPAR